MASPAVQRSWLTAVIPDADAAGCYVGPTILDDVTPDMEIAQEEVFGPVLCVIRAATLDEAISIVNSSRFGNGTSIFTESGASERRYRHEVQAGMIGVNIGVAAPVAFFPFSGWKDSFLGDLHAHGTGCGRVLHAQEDRHQPLVLRRPGPRQLLRRGVSDARCRDPRRPCRSRSPSSRSAGVPPRTSSG